MHESRGLGDVYKRQGFSLFTGLLFRRLFEVTTQLHFTKDAFALHLLLQRLERLVYIVVAYNYMHRQLPRVGVKIVQVRCCQTCDEAEAGNKK